MLQKPLDSGFGKGLVDLKMPIKPKKLSGPRHEIKISSKLYPESLKHVQSPPKTLYVLGDPSTLVEGLAIIGARRATPYGIGAAKRFGELAAKNNVVVISGGARGCDCASQKAAIDAGGKTVTFLASIDDVYPKENFDLFQRIIDSGGALVSENEWSEKSIPVYFRKRNRLIAGLARATLIVEAGIPSGTFSTADDALNLNREVLVVPGAITSKQSSGSNRLIYQGATPIIDDETFLDELSMLFGVLKSKPIDTNKIESENLTSEDKILLEALQASNLSVDELLLLVKRGAIKEDEALSHLMLWLANATAKGWISIYPDGRYGPAI